MSDKINITSTAIEKGIDLAKDFLDKLILPTVEETGLLLKDQVAMWRFKNQIKMIIKAKEVCEKFKIEPKTVSLKVLCPLLDYAGLEENEILQDKWSNLLANMVDSTQNIENHVFPYLLSQVSVDEFMMIEYVYKIKVERVRKLGNELEIFLADKSAIEHELREQILQFDIQIKVEKENKSNAWETSKKKWDKEKELREMDNKERTIRNSMRQPESVPYGELKDYEVSNLIRLGVIKNIPRPYAYIVEQQGRNGPDSEYLQFQDLEIKMDADEDDLILTELGELFVAACNEKKKENAP